VCVLEGGWPWSSFGGQQAIAGFMANSMMGLCRVCVRSLGGSGNGGMKGA